MHNICRLQMVSMMSTYDVPFTTKISMMHAGGGLCKGLVFVHTPTFWCWEIAVWEGHRNSFSDQGVVLCLLWYARN